MLARKQTSGRSSAKLIELVSMSGQERGRGGMQEKAGRWHRGAVVVALVALLPLLLLEVAIWAGQNASEQRQHAQTRQVAEELRGRLDGEFNAAIYMNRALAAFLVAGRGQVDDAQLALLLPQLYQSSRHIRNFALAIDTRIKYVYPLRGNESVLGVDYRNLKQQWPAIEAAIAGRREVLTEPLMLVQGGRAVIYRLPLFIDDHYWGMLSSVIDLESLLRAALKEWRPEGLQLAIMAGERRVWGEDDARHSPVKVLSSYGWQVFAQPRLTPFDDWPWWLLRLSLWTVVAVMALFSHRYLIQREQLVRRGLYDAVTGLPNRHLLEDRLQLALYRCHRRQQGRVMLLLIDLDGFKVINDRYGHKAGDEVLRRVATSLRQHARAEDTVARWGGDEFVVIAEQTHELEAASYCERIRAAIEEISLLGARQARVSASMGYALAPDEGEDQQLLFSLADQRMYADKKARRQAISD